MKVTTKQEIELYVLSVLDKSLHVPDNLEFKFKLTKEQFDEYVKYIGSRMQQPSYILTYRFQNCKITIHCGKLEHTSIVRYHT